MLYFLYCIGFFLIRILPLKVCYGAAEVVARFYYVFSRKDKEALRENLRVVLGEDASPEEIDAYILGVFRNFGKYLADFFKFFRLSKEYILEHIEIKGLHYLDKYLSEGKGLIIVAAHLGNWELGGFVVGVMGYLFNEIVLEHKDRRINDLFVRQRRANNIKVIHFGMQLKQCFKALKSNELLAIAADKDYTGNNECVDFFGRKAFLPKGAAVLSLRTGAPIIACSLVRNTDNTFKMVFEEPIKHERTGDDEKDMKAIMEGYLAIFEKHIREYPDQWYVFEKIWEQELIIR